MNTFEITNKLVVAKFGGSSVRDFERMRCSSVLASKQGARVVIVSALQGVTNHLEKMTYHCRHNLAEEYAQNLEDLRDRHKMIAGQIEGLEESGFIDKCFDRLKTLIQAICWLEECGPRARDEILAFGERLSSYLFFHVHKDTLKNHSAIQVSWINSQDYIATDQRHGEATPLPEIIAERTRSTLKTSIGDHCFVAGGFIGQGPDGKTTTLGRGGSDLSAALYAEALDADELQIWTDVCGIASVDPRIVPHAVGIDEISYSEAAEMAHYGAKVLHPTTLTPLQRKNIPVYIGNTENPDGPGTWIRRRVQFCPLVRGLAIKKGQKLVTLRSAKMYQTFGFLARAFAIFEDFHLSVDAIVTSEVSVACSLDSNQEVSSDFLTALKSLGDVQLEEQMCLVSIVGTGLDLDQGVGEKIFSAAHPSVKIRMLGQGASPHHIGILIREEQTHEMVHALYDQLVAVSYAGKENNHD